MKKPLNIEIGDKIILKPIALLLAEKKISYAIGDPRSSKDIHYIRYAPDPFIVNGMLPLFTNHHKCMVEWVDNNKTEENFLAENYSFRKEWVQKVIKQK